MATYKLTQKQLADLHKAIGLDVEVVADDAADASYNQDNLLLAVDASREGIISQKVLGAKTDEIHKTVSGKVNNAARKAIAELTGIPVADISDKDISEAAKIAFEHYGKKIGADKETIQKQIDDILEAQKAELSKINKGWEDKYNQKVGELTEREVLEALAAAHKDAKGLPPGANIQMLAKQFKNHVESQAILKIENGKPVLYQKDKPELRLLNQAGTMPAEVNDFIKPYYSEMGLWHEDNRNIPVPPPGPVAHSHPVASPDGKILNHVDQLLSAIPADYGMAKAS